MKYQRIALINPPLNAGVAKCIDDGFWAPLNLLTLSSYLRSSGYRGEVRIFDQAVMSPPQITAALKEFRPDLIGLSPNVDSYQQALKLAALGRELGAATVTGGAYATSLAEAIITRQECIDFVIVHEGEKALAALASGAGPDQVPNLMYRSHGKILATPIIGIDRATLSEIDYSAVDMEQYFTNYRRSIHPGGYQRPLTILSQRGCIWREKTDGCLFCSRLNKKAVFDPPEEVWRRIAGYRERYHIDSLIDVGDDFLGNMSWFRRFHAARPDSLRDLGIRFIYSRVEHIDETTAQMLADLNVVEICLGLESGDRDVLREVRKGNTPQQHLRAIRLLAEHGINIIAAFMLGHPRESIGSMERTCDHIGEVLSYHNTNELVVSIFTPLPGSQAHNMLLKQSPRFASSCRNLDEFPVREAQREWIDHFCNVDLDTIMSYAGKMQKLDRHAYIEFN